MAIYFFTEDVKYNLKNKRLVKNWLSVVINRANYKIGELNYIFCSDSYLLELNQNHLNHDTFTDIITFDNSDEERLVEGDIYISIDRVKENATTHKVDFEIEILRIISHGVLHLLGYKDKTNQQAEVMREKEEEAIDLYHSLTVPRGTVKVQ